MINLILGERAMAKSDFDDKDVALVAAFDTEGEIKWVEHADGRKVTELTAGSFEKGPLTNINLLKTHMIDILIYEQQDEKGNTVRRVCAHSSCRIYC